MSAQMNNASRGWSSKVRVSMTGLRRWFKYKYLLLFRAKGGAAKVSIGFAIGLFVEMFTLPTFGLAFFLIFPLVYLFRSSLAGALIGFVFGKVIYIPMAFFNNKVGGWIVPDNINKWITFLPEWLERMLYVNIKLIVGGMVDGILLGLLFYWPIKLLLELYTARRTEKRRARRALLSSASVTVSQEDQP
ncbi:DUF2062 domain-containing protein [Paenibacillus koleovorans]|uniref:DUF2062 domain-containing protein n=1 Tax=Paenibacillus koleovorans TaxID=121608 RepID=UPI0027D7A622|nr:DUF2062 domain-containing protein [Paenibacillus koleovorans]